MRYAHSHRAHARCAVSCRIWRAVGAIKSSSSFLTDSSMNQSAAALSGSFAPADRFKKLKIRKDFQASIRYKIPRWPLLRFHQRFLGFSTFSKFLILFYHITGILAIVWTKLRIIPAKLQDFRCVSCHSHFQSLRPWPHILHRHASFFKAPILSKKFGKDKVQ